MGTPDVRNRRLMLLSAPPLSHLPRLDTHLCRRELILPERRNATAKIRRFYQESRRHDYVDDTTRKAEIEKLKQYKVYLDNMKLLGPKTEKTCDQAKENDVWQKEITKRDLPIRLPITVPARLKSVRVAAFRSEHLPNINPVFYRVSFSPVKGDSDRKHVIKQKLQYFISQDWSSEKASWNNLDKNVPEYQKANWIC